MSLRVVHTRDRCKTAAANTAHGFDRKLKIIGRAGVSQFQIAQYPVENARRSADMTSCSQTNLDYVLAAGHQAEGTVKGRDLINLGERYSEFAGYSAQCILRQIRERVLDVL